MARSLPAGALDVLTSRSFITCELIELELSTPLYLNSSQYDIVATTATSQGQQTFLAQGQFLNYSGVRETDEMRVNTVNVSFSGATNQFINIALNDRILHRPFRIYKVFINSSNLALLTEPVMIYDGTIVGATVEESSDNSIVTLQTANEFYDFERRNGRRTNTGSQQRFFPGDLGMDFSTKSISDIKWGRAS
jgi:hypothetical protein